MAKEACRCQFKCQYRDLNSKFHLSIEHSIASCVLAAMFKGERYFAHHTALPVIGRFGDEAAANHARFCKITVRLK